MDEARDFAVISVPFTTGIAVAAFTGPATGCPYADAAILTAVCVLSTVYVWKSKCTKTKCIALMLLLGIFCAKSSFLCGEIRLPLAGGIDIVANDIHSTGFRGKDTEAVLSAFLTGGRNLLSQDLKEAFRNSGASHLLALSGLHLGTIYVIMNKCLIISGNSRAGALVRSGICILACLWYTLATGASPSVERAFLFICLNEASRLSPGRKRNAANIFLCAMMFQLAVSPSQIRSISFQLSYLAMAGIIFLFPKLDAIYPESARFDPVRKIWSATALCLSCQIFTAPLAWYRFHTFPTHFLLTNILALPLTELLITFGIASVAIFDIFGHCPAFLTESVDFLCGTLIFCLETISSM